MSTDEPVQFCLPHPVDAMCRQARKSLQGGAVVLFGGQQLIVCSTQDEVETLLGIKFVEPRVAEEPASFKARGVAAKARGGPPAWMSEPSLLPKKPPGQA